MRKSVLVTAMALGIVGAFGVPSATAQVISGDSAVLTGAPADAEGLVLNEIRATSGPSGENPDGRIAFEVPLLSLSLSGPVTCLAVTGQVATINFRDETPGDFGIVTVEVVDGQPDTFDVFPINRAPTDCSPLPSGRITFPISGGDIVVVDAPPLPTSQDQCKNGGWRTYGVFKNQGDCVSFVATGGKNPPAKSP